MVWFMVGSNIAQTKILHFLLSHRWRNGNSVLQSFKASLKSQVKRNFNPLVKLILIQGS